MFILVAFLFHFLLIRSFQGTKAFKVRFVFSSEFYLARLSTNLENRRKQRKGTSVSFYVSSCLLRPARSPRLNERNRISNVATSEGSSQSGLKISFLFSWLGFTPWRNFLRGVQKERDSINVTLNCASWNCRQNKLLILPFFLCHVPPSARLHEASECSFSFPVLVKLKHESGNACPFMHATYEHP